MGELLLRPPYRNSSGRRVSSYIGREGIEKLNAGKSWPPGTFQRLLDLADEEDAGDEQSYLSDDA